MRLARTTGVSQAREAASDSMLKAAIFDLGGVYFNNGTRVAIKKISEKYNLPEKRVSATLDTDLGSKYRTDEINADEFWREFKRQLGIDARTEELLNIWFEGYTPIEGTVNLIRKLRSDGIKVFYLSDNIWNRVNYLNENSIFSKILMGVFFHSRFRRENPI